MINETFKIFADFSPCGGANMEIEANEVEMLDDL